MSGIGGGAFYLFCFEEVRCERLEQCSSKRFVEEGWVITTSKGFIIFYLPLESITKRVRRKK